MVNTIICNNCSNWFFLNNVSAICTILKFGQNTLSITVENKKEIINKSPFCPLVSVKQILIEKI